MEIFRVSFIGHREVDCFFTIEEQLEDIIKNLIKSAVKGKFRLNRKALIVTLNTDEEIIFAISNKHKKWFELMDKMVNYQNGHEIQR